MAHVRCEQHEIFYNTDGPGCPVCRSAPTKQRTGRGWRDVGIATRATAVVVAIIVSTSFVRTFAAPPRNSSQSAGEAERMELQRADVDPASTAGPIPVHEAETRTTAAGTIAGIRTELQMLTDLHAVLTSTVESGRKQLLRLPEPVRDRQSPEAARLQREWDSARESVLASLESASGRIPHDYKWSRDGDRALRSMERAATGLAATLQRATLPSRTSRESSFERASDQLERTTTYLARLEQ